MEPRIDYVGTSDPLNALRDIGTPEDIKTLVDVFYEKVNQDEMLAPFSTMLQK